LSAAPPDRAPSNTIGVPIVIDRGPKGIAHAPPLLLKRIRPPFLLLLLVQSRNLSNRPYRRFCNPIRPGRNRPRPLYSLPLLPH
ncbi:hypothetical protein L249_7082, partial [Ophiocordyceps polyrhachis-furcata BCC 54312]